MGKLFGTDGIRGRANRYPMTAQMALEVGRAVALIVGKQKHGSVVVGRDTRLSGDMLEAALSSGLMSMGLDVLQVGILPTPAVAGLIGPLGANAAVMLTASHNPYSDNGIKIFDSEGFKLSDEVEMRLERAILEDDSLGEHETDETGRLLSVEQARGLYIDKALSSVPDLRLRGMKIILDCANGAAFSVAPEIFRKLGADLVTVSAEPNGRNINSGCGATHPELIADLVIEHGADLGITLDGDADRIIMSDPRGRVVNGDRILGILAIDMKDRDVLAHDTLVATCMSNLGLRQAMSARDISTVSTDVGDRQVVLAMRSGGFNLGGEISGHVVMMDHGTSGDGIMAALQILWLMKRTGAKLDELACFMTDHPQKLISLPVADKPPLESLDSVQEALDSCRTELGADGRVMLRYSGTENKIRLLMEAKDPVLVETWSERLVGVIRTAIG